MSIDAEWGLAMRVEKHNILMQLRWCSESESNLVYELGETNELRPKIGGD
jgi:hypothetical protein